MKGGIAVLTFYHWWVVLNPTLFRDKADALPWCQTAKFHSGNNGEYVRFFAPVNGRLGRPRDTYKVDSEKQSSRSQATFLQPATVICKQLTFWNALVAMQSSMQPPSSVAEHEYLTLLARNPV